MRPWILLSIFQNRSSSARKNLINHFICWMYAVLVIRSKWLSYIWHISLNWDVFSRRVYEANYTETNYLATGDGKRKQVRLNNRIRLQEQNKLFIIMIQNVVLSVYTSIYIYYVCGASEIACNVFKGKLFFLDENIIHVFALLDELLRLQAFKNNLFIERIPLCVFSVLQRLYVKSERFFFFDGNLMIDFTSWQTPLFWIFF